MLINIISKEFRLNLSSFRFSFALILCLITSFIIALVLCEEYKNSREDYRENMKYANWYFEGEHSIFEHMYSGIRIYKPLNPMNILFSGIIKENFSEVQISIDKSALIKKKEAGNFMNFLFKHLDIGFFISVVMSLIAIVFGYDAVTREKEDGTLKLLLTSAVSRVTFIFGKIIGGFLSFAIPFTLSYFVILFLMLIYPEVNAFEWMGTNGSLYLLSLLYLFIFYLLSVLVSSNCKLGQTSINILLLIWVMAVLIIPSFGTYISATYSKTNYAKLEHEKSTKNSAFLKGYWTRRWEVGQKGLKGKEFNEKLSELVVKDTEKHFTEIKKLDEDYFKKLDKELKLTKYITYISPRAIFLLAAIEIADTGIKDFRRFYKSVFNYKKDFYKAVFSGMRKMKGQWEPYMVDDGPVYNYKQAKYFDRVRPVSTEILILAMSVLVLMIGIIISIFRYDVT